MIGYGGHKTGSVLNERGFTLLEIIAVLVILSILAVVAVPRYFDLQEEAKKKAIKTALAEGIGRVNGYFAKQVLAGNTPGEIEYSNNTLGTDLGDFNLNVSAAGQTQFRLTVTGKTNTPLAGESDGRTITRPGRI